MNQVKDCLNCNEEFLPSRKVQKFCSIECYRGVPAKPRPQSTCLRCKIPINITHQGKKYCGIVCYRKRLKTFSKELKEDKPRILSNNLDVHSLRWETLWKVYPAARKIMLKIEERLPIKQEKVS